MKIIAIHQPNYLPWIGFFNKVARVDEFIILDNVEYSHQSYTNRSRIRKVNGSQVLTIPIERSERRKPICKVEMPKSLKWRNDHWKSIEANYSKAPFFQDLKDSFKIFFIGNNCHKLSDFNTALIKHILDILSLKPSIILSSNLDVDNFAKSELILEICKKVEATCYLSGPSGRNYLELGRFAKAGIKVIFQGFIHPIYSQRFPNFEKGMSIIDLIFNEGPEKSREIILRE